MDKNKVSTNAGSTKIGVGETSDRRFPLLFHRHLSFSNGKRTYSKMTSYECLLGATVALRSLPWSLPSSHRPLTRSSERARGEFARRTVPTLMPRGPPRGLPRLPRSLRRCSAGASPGLLRCLCPHFFAMLKKL